MIFCFSVSSGAYTICLPSLFICVCYVYFAVVVIIFTRYLVLLLFLLPRTVYFGSLPLIYIYFVRNFGQVVNDDLDEVSIEGMYSYPPSNP